MRTPPIFRDKSLLTPFVLFLFSFLIRFVLIGKGPFHPDSLFLVRQAQKTLETGQLQGYLTGYNLPVLFGSLSIWICQKIGWDNPVGAANLTSVLFGALCIPVFYLFCRKVTNEWTAFFSSIMLSTLPLFWSLSTFAGSQTPALFFLFLGLNFLVNYKNNHKQSFWYSAISFGFLGACRPQELVFMAGAIAYLYFSKLIPFTNNFSTEDRQNHLLRFFIFCGLILLTTFLIPIPFLFHQGIPPSFNTIRNLYHAYISQNSNNVSTILPMFNFGFMAMMDNLSAFIIISAVYGFFIMRREKPRLMHFLFLWIFCTFCGYTALFHKVTPTDRYLLLAMPPWAIAAGYTFAILIKNKNKIIQGVSLLIFLLIPILFSARIIPPLSFRHHNDLPLNLSKWISSSTEKDAIIIAMDEENFLNQYGERKAVLWPQNSKDLVWLHKEIVQRHPVYILIPKTMFPSDEEFIEYLQRNYHLTFIGKYISEWWQHATITLRILPHKLYKIEMK